MRGAKVFLIEGDAECLRLMEGWIGDFGQRCASFLTVHEFVVEYSGEPGCMVIDMNASGYNELCGPDGTIRWDSWPPAIFTAVSPDTAECVRLMKHGAVNVLIKPIDRQHLHKALNEALHRDEGQRLFQKELYEFQGRLDILTQREKQVLSLLINGMLNKQIAGELRVCEKTIKVHRGRIMRKMNSPSLILIARQMERLGVCKKCSCPLNWKKSADPPSGAG